MDIIVHKTYIMYSEKKILLIEDNDDVIHLWKALFREFPALIHTSVRTVETAREVLSKIQFDLIFLDGNLTVSGPEPQPETFPLFLEIKDKYSGKIVFISNYDPYVELMKQYGVPHVEKADAPDFAHSVFNTVRSQMIPSKNFYELKVGNLLVIHVMKNPFFSHKPAYIAEITATGPLELKIGEEISILKPGGYTVLESESRLIQGTLEEQNALLKYFREEAHEGALRSGLSCFGGVLTEIFIMPTSEKKS